MLLRQLMWITISVVVSVSINFGMYYALGDAAFPWNFVVIIGLFLLIGFMAQRRAMKKMGMLPGKAGKTQYQCFKCGEFYKGNVCPKCGARGGKMVFSGGNNPFGI